MKRSKIILGVLILALLAGAGKLLACVSCKEAHEHGGKKEEKGTISHYTCPMHPQIHEDHPGECPICHMKLVPVYKEAPPPAETAPGGPSVMISPERQQMIGIKTETAVKRPVTKEIRTVGRVAFDPELAVAQREYLEIVRNVPSLKAAARSRLRLLGMSEEEINDLGGGSRTAPTNLYLPGPGESVWVYATLYQEEMNLVPQGTRAVISLPMNQARSAVEGEAPSGFAGGGGDASPYYGTIRAIDPIVDPTTRSARARIEVPGAGGRLRPDTYVNVSLKIDLGEAITIPKSAVIDTGIRKVAFAVHEGRHFQSRDITTGPEVGDDVVVQEGIAEGEKVVASATFLVDSESQLKAAISGMEGHKH